jgi:23S rRNA (guanosine2251-2'-O)-methyltransferase
MIIYGLNPVLEALRAGRARRLTVGPRADKRIEEAIALARRRGVPIDRVEPSALERVARGGAHQGIAADVDAPRDYAIGDLIAAAAPAAPLIVVLDGIEDPHNVGAILRSVDAAGAHGVVRQERHAAALDGVVAKASAGAVSTVRIATVVNIARAVEELTEAGVWAVGLAGDAPEPYDQVDLTLPTAIVLGAEGSGLRRLVRDRCDRLASIPMGGSVESLNVSVAAGVMLFEAVRQRRAAAGNGPKRPRASN